ncbi:MAG: glycosyl hydrolase family 8, partial [Pseudomonadota bacterium]
DAIRIPVYAAWGGLEAQADLARFETFWAGFPDAGAPDHVDLVTGRISGRRDVGGAQAIRAMTRNVLVETDALDAPRLPYPAIDGPTNYYSGMINLLAQNAALARLRADEAAP